MQTFSLILHNCRRTVSCIKVDSRYLPREGSRESQRNGCSVFFLFLFLFFVFFISVDSDVGTKVEIKEFVVQVKVPFLTAEDLQEHDRKTTGFTMDS